jgi:ParB family transcriptional regulator, chromosome partitioning protein
MAKAVQKITLSSSRDIPFNKLVLSQSNVRRVKAGLSIEQLAGSIAQRTLLQSLNVRAVVDAEGNETGMFKVPAGGRRYRALELLVKQKRMAKTQPVPCVVREGGIAEDDSIAENDERVGLHPLDQFRAFQTLRSLGMSEEDIAAQLKVEAETIAAEGWKWIEVAVSFPYGHDEGLRQLDGTSADITADEQATIDALQAEQAKIEAEYQDADELPDEVDARLGEIEEALSAFDSRPHIFDPVEIARAGAFVSIDGDGCLLVDRGFVRPEDETPVEEPGADGDADSSPAMGTGPDGSSVRQTVITVGGQAEPEEEEDDGIKPLPDRLVMELTAHRTLALRDAVASNPHVAITALLHKLCLDTFQREMLCGCLQASVREVHFSAQASDLKDSASAKAIDDRNKAWAADMPADEAGLWDWLAALDDASRSALLAHCVSFGVNALFEKVDRYGGNGVSPHGMRRRIEQADRLARAVNLDMVEAGWRPTVDNYLGRVTKSRILEAIREAKGEAVGTTHRPPQEE